METQTRLRPPQLQPIWTEPRRVGGYPASPYTAHDPAYSPSMRSPNTPSLLYPRSPGYDHSMRQHERAMVDRLDQRNWPPPLDSPSFHTPPRFLAPITEFHGRDRRSSIAPLPQAHAYARSSRSPNIRPLEYDYPRRPTLADESRPMSFSRLLEPPQSTVHSSLVDRRQSLPPSLAAARLKARQRRQELRAWGHVYLGNGLSANCFVVPHQLKKPSGASPGGEENAAEREKEYSRQKRLTINTRIRPRLQGRRAFRLQRTFDMDQLRATVPDPEPTSPVSRRQSADSPPRKSQPYDPTEPKRKSPVDAVPIRKSQRYSALISPES